MSDVLSGGGEMGERIRSFEWSQTPLGAIKTWPQSLKTAVRIMLASRQPIWLGWGEHLIKLYNDPYKAIVGGKHPAALGQPADVVWREIWDAIGPMLDTAMGGVEGTYVEAQLLIMERNGYPEETYYTFSYSPIPDDDGAVGGIICANTDDTHRVISERQLALLRELAAKTADARTVEAACALSADGLATNPCDLPFALIYLVEPDAQHVVLTGKGGQIEPGHPAAPERVALDGDTVWPFADVLATSSFCLISDLSAFAGNLPTGTWDRPPHQAVAIPIAARGRVENAGILVVGLNPYRLFDDAYWGFLDLVAAQIAASIANAQAYEEERKRVEALAEIDRAKTVFFSNVSHEFRTPLTLLLGHLEDLLQKTSSILSSSDREQLEVAQRNGLRLLKLVNTLLDFSRIEAGRIQASYGPIDLAALTTDLASVFRSTVERAGLSFRVSCPPLQEPVYVDSEMWEKIVFNLLSNAFKFTFVGEIAVTLRQVGELVELAVSDSGIGIPADELPHIFERFHRVGGARGRTFEGSGIGLALVQELVKLHGGTVGVESVTDHGSTFTVSIPLGSAHLPADRIGAARTLASTEVRGAAYIEEALRWLPLVEEVEVEGGGDRGQGDTETGDRGTRGQGHTEAADTGTGGHGDMGIEVRNSVDTSSLPVSQPPSLPVPMSSFDAPRILVADDNADMRAYILRLLSPEYTVVVVGDGAAALRALHTQSFDLVLTDVMMPGIDGYELLRILRTDEYLRAIPVIMLSARADEEARVEGMDSGADDYLTKPFSARELIARVRANLELARIRREATQREYQLRKAAELVTERLQRILESIKDDFVMYDDSWRYVYVNDKAAQSLGYPKGQLIGQCIWDLFPHAIGNLFYHEMLRSKAERQEVVFEHYYEPWNQWIENRAYPMPDGMLLFSTDITERKQAEAERAHQLEQERRLRNQAEEASRLKDEFLATVSHELRTPLTAFLGYAQMLQRRRRDEAYIARAVEKMVRSAKDQAQLIEDLLDVSRIVSGKLRIELQPINLVTVIQAALDTVHPTIEAKELHLHVELNPDAGTVIGDANRLQQVVWNLLSNATKFTPPGGHIQVRLELHRRDAQLSVSDNGQGISPAFLPYVFDRFSQADSTSTRIQGGLGLGLAIVRHLVELHGGTVEAASVGEGWGSTFIVRLPLVSDEGLAERAAAHSMPLESPRDKRCPPVLDGRRILLVDDQPDILELIHEILVPCGVIVRTCDTAQAALETLRTWKPDVLVSDIAMPGNDGYWLIGQVRALAPEDGGATPAVALTAYVRVEERLHVLGAGFQLYVPKPIDPDELLAVVARLVQISEE